MKIVKLLWVSVFVVFVFPLVAVAQEATERPFPVAQATATERAFPVAQATATERTFPIAATPTDEVVDDIEVDEVATETTSEVILADVQATAGAAEAMIVRLEAERDSLQTELEASRADNGATIFAVVVITLGVLLALAVFFGLRRYGE